jgi:serine/threonine protein kinase
MLLSQGQTLNRYQIIALLGEGGMGSVYQAHDPRLQRDVAIKVMHPYFARQPSFCERFTQEARTAARLDHPGIVKIFDSGEENDILYIVMEFIHGPNLRQILANLAKEKRLVILTEAAQVVRQVCLALEYAHRNGVLHRDIKPDNIMLKPEPVESLPYRPVLTDLGLAKLLEGIPITQEGESLGTPAYMSPEQALGKPVDARSDVYSLGILLYELCVGRLPFPAKTLSEAIRYHTQVMPPPPAAIRVDLHEALAKVILKCLEKDPALRFSHASELAEAIGAALRLMPQGRPITTIPQPDTGASSLMAQYQVGLAESLGATPQGIKPRQSPRPGTDGIVIMVKDKTARTVLLKNKKVTIGRGEDSDILLDDPKASRHHVQVEFDGANYQVIDMNSTNGTILGNTPLLAGVPVVWNPEKLLRIGDTWLRLERTSPAPVKAKAETGLPAYTGSIGGRVGISLEPRVLSVNPGGIAAVNITIINQSPVVDHFTLSLSGVPAEWIAGASNEAQLMPGMRHETSVTIQPPYSPTSRAGSYTLAARVSSRAAPDDVAEERVVLTVTPFFRLDAGLHPQKLRSHDAGTFSVSASNQGNADLWVSFGGSDPEDGCLYTFDPARLLIPAGEERKAQLSVRPKSSLSEWSARTYFFTVSVQSEAEPGLGQQIHGELEQVAPALEMNIRPQKQKGASQGSFSVQVSNHGQGLLKVRLEASDPEEGCRYLFNPGELSIAPGQESTARLMVYPKSLLYGDQVKTYLFTVTGRLADTPGLLRQVQGEWEQAAHGVEMNLLPQKQSGSVEGKFSIQLSNRSDAELILDLKAADPGQLCRYILNPTRLTLPVGETRNVDLKVLPLAPLAENASRQILFDVSAWIVGATTALVKTQGEWEQWLPPAAAPEKAGQVVPVAPEKQAGYPDTDARARQPEIPVIPPGSDALAKPKRSFMAGCLLFLVGIALTLLGTSFAGESLTPYDYSMQSLVLACTGSVFLVGFIMTLVIALRAYQKKSIGKLVLICVLGFIAIFVISVLKASRILLH